ncbi:hypothetical protein [Chitinimonas sp. BJB300]|uniref:hypothetical protein n=1 Tax=Chitinimonas sp. BJB300 TaxID=1559339 RepID=UPI000C0D7B8F|nr:hypothetical protein [Chitinimonas sp. BJB300]PHV11201.1 hypothetical protein CSQ89_12190 [Chitinimonas sp. BJB300]TSJ89038.1 hypothetical protein FG002_009150 [Chitinimonas sp. BJB300]
MDAVKESRLDEGLARIFGIAPDKAGVNLDAIRTKAAVSLAAYGKLLAELFARQKLPVPPPVQLQWWGEGSRIQVIGNHPDKLRIEVLLNGDGELVEAFKELELLHEIMRNAEQGSQFTDLSQHFNLGITSTGPLAFYTD